jgi:hypothetical protein
LRRYTKERYIAAVMTPASPQYVVGPSSYDKVPKPF